MHRDGGNYPTRSIQIPFVHEFGVIARKQIPGGKVIEGLNEYVDDIKDEELNPGMEFSLLRKSKVYGKQSVMLGPTSFVNHSDRMHDTPWVENHLRNRLLKSKRYERLMNGRKSRSITVTIILEKTTKTVSTNFA